MSKTELYSKQLELLGIQDSYSRAIMRCALFQFDELKQFYINERILINAEIHRISQEVCHR